MCPLLGGTPEIVEFLLGRFMGDLLGNEPFCKLVDVSSKHVDDELCSF